IHGSVVFVDHIHGSVNVVVHIHGSVDVVVHIRDYVLLIGIVVFVNRALVVVVQHFDNDDVVRRHRSVGLCDAKINLIHKTNTI
uniref:Uncharacterized protein n=1 Tax=Onchocerca volvulus TaxID=6282 RepID=A0A8R1XNF0_ONCVO